LTIAVKATTTLDGNNFNAVFEMLSGPGAFFFFLTIFRISEGEAGVMGVSSRLERMRRTWFSISSMWTRSASTTMLIAVFRR
jgi:hypothetical protein